MNSYHSIGWQMLIAGIILFIIASLTQTHLPLNEIPAEAWLSIWYLVIFGSLLSFAAFIYSMQKLPAAIASLYAYINPLVAMIAGYFVLQEKLTLNILWGSVVTLTGVFMVNYSIKRSAAIAEAEI